MKRVRCVPVGTSVLATCVASLLGTSAIAADLRGPDEPYSYKDGPAIAGGANWAGFYVGGRIGGRWGNGDSQGVSVSGGDGGGGGGGGGDNNVRGTPDLIDGAAGAGGNAGGLGGAGGNSIPLGALAKRIGGDGGNGGAGGQVTSDGDDDDSIIGGLHMGYNWQRGSIVFGIEGDASFNGGLDNYLASLRGRVGIARDDAFFYITGGLAIRDSGGADAYGLASNGGSGGTGGKNDDGIDDSGEVGHAETFGGIGGGGGAGGTPTAAGFSKSDGGSDTGVVVGAGVEYMISSNVSAGFEGLWYSFDDDQDMTVLRARLTLHLDRAPHDSFKDGYLSASIANWSGFYVGGNAGVGFGNGKRVKSVKTANGHAGSAGEAGAASGSRGPGGVPKADGTDDPGGAGGGGGGGAAALVSLEDDAGALAGIHLGYNWQSGSRVFGLEGDANWADSSFRDYLASVRIRLGHSFDRVLVYGTAGVAFSRSGGGVASVSLSDGGGNGLAQLNGENGQFENDTVSPLGGGSGGAGGVAGVASVTESGGGEDKVGFVVGGGFEVKLWDRTSFGVEGLYYGFDGSDASLTSTSYDAGDDLSSAVVRGRLTFHLDGGAETDSLK